MDEYTPIYTPKPPDYSWTQVREWDQHVKYIRQTEGNIVEIGANRGYTTCLFCINFPRRKIYAVDWIPTAGDQAMHRNQTITDWLDPKTKYLYHMPTDTGEFKDIVAEPLSEIAELAKQMRNVVIVNTNSHIYDYNQFEDVTYFFIDGDHGYEGVKADTEKAIAYLQSHRGGFIMLHDYNNSDKYPWIKVREYADKELKPRFSIHAPRKTMLGVFKVEKQ